MGIFDLLSGKEDLRKGGSDCQFNGYLEDYFDSLEEGPVKEVLGALFAKDNSLKIIVKLYLGVSKNSISNAIIRYKDIFKFENKAMVIPYIVYGKKDGKEKALILVDDDYIYAKGLYYSLTEPASAFQEVKNDCVALDFSNKELILDVYDALFYKRAGQIQRDIDKRYFADYDSSFAKALALSKDIGDSCLEGAANADDKEEYIRSCVAKWFLIKKFVYVQYMVDKDILASRHEGNVKQQRNKAKENADAIRFTSVSDMWRYRSYQKG